MRSRAPLLGALLAAAALAAAGTGVIPGTASATTYSLTPSDTSVLKLTSLDASGTSLFTTYTSAANAVEAKYAGDGLTKVDIGDVLANGARTTHALDPIAGCGNNYFPDTWALPDASGFCWQGKTGTADTYSNDDTGDYWFPQGLTGSGDATAAGTWTANGTAYYAVAVGWGSSNCYGKDLPYDGGTNPACDATPNTYSRITVADITHALGGAPYATVMLAEPVGDGYGPLASHVGGLTWYGHTMFVATNKWIDVFSVDRIWKVTSANAGPTDFGCVDGSPNVCTAGGYRYVMPLIGRYMYADHTIHCASVSGSHPCLDSLSLDRSTTPDSLVTVEVHNAPSGRIVRWPLDEASERLAPTTPGGTVVQATQAWNSPITTMQGAVSYDATYAVTGTCLGNTASPPSQCISHTAPGGTTLTKWTDSPKNSENLAYFPSSQNVWLDNEPLSDRLTFRWHCPNLVC